MRKTRSSTGWRAHHAAVLALVMGLCGCGGAQVDKVNHSEASSQLSEPYRQLQASGLEVLADGFLQGSGFIVGERWAATAAHAIVDADRIEVLTVDGTRWPVRVLAQDIAHDTVLLELREENAQFNAPALELNTDLPAVGDDLFLFGAPYFRHHLFFTGRVARSELTFEYLSDLRYYFHILHLNALLPVGTSGGPWVDAQGKVVGIQSGMMHAKGAPVGVFYMAPIFALAKLMQTRHDACSPDLGVAVIELWESHSYVEQFPVGARGLVISQVRAHGTAQAAGLEVGMLITHVNNQPVQFRDELFLPLYDGSGRTELTLTVQTKAGETKTVTVQTRCLEVRE